MKKQLIQIDGAGFENKGSELMLTAVISRLKALGQPVDITFHSRNGTDGPKAAQLGLYQLFTYRKYRIPFYKVVPQSILEPYGLTTYNQTNHVLDIGGYQIGDHWKKPQYYIDRVKSVYKAVHYKGGKVIYLPQAFGPFEKPESRTHLKSLFPHIDKIYARDQYSLDNIKSVIGESDKVECFPDFTPLLSVQPKKGDESSQSLKNKVGVIPNFKMVQSKVFESEIAYVQYLNTLIERLKDLKFEIVVINHEGEKDRAIIHSLKAGFGGHIEIADQLSGIEVKQLISTLRVLYSDRYHGVVSGLSNFVPTFTAGWSHKYQALYEDFAFEKGIQLPIVDNIVNEIAILNDYAIYQDKVNGLKVSTNEIRRKNEKMWRDIMDLITQ